MISRSLVPRFPEDKILAITKISRKRAVLGRKLTIFSRVDSGLDLPRPPIIKTCAHQKELHELWLELKTIEDMIINIRTDGTNCSPLKSEIIVENAED